MCRADTSIRFGPKILQWKAASVREYIFFGLQNSIGFYIFSGGIMLILSRKFPINNYLDMHNTDSFGSPW